MDLGSPVVTLGGQDDPADMRLEGETMGLDDMMQQIELDQWPAYEGGAHSANSPGPTHDAPAASPTFAAGRYRDSSVSPSGMASEDYTVMGSTVLPQATQVMLPRAQPKRWHAGGVDRVASSL